MCKVIAADGLYKRDILSEFSISEPTACLGFGKYTEGRIRCLLSTPLGFPDPFAVVTVDGEQTHTTSVIRKTLNPYWNESFDMYCVPQTRGLESGFPGFGILTVTGCGDVAK